MRTLRHTVGKATLLFAIPFALQISTVTAWGQATDPFAAPVAYETSDKWAEPAQAQRLQQQRLQQQRPWLLRSPFANISWPKVELPRFQLLPAFGDPDRPRILGQNQPSLFETITNTPARLAARTRQAWNRSLEKLKFVGGSNRPEGRGPWLGRLFGNEDPQDEGPRTVKEWMSQDRMKL